MSETALTYLSGFFVANRFQAVLLGATDTAVASIVWNMPRSCRATSFSSLSVTALPGIFGAFTVLEYLKTVICITFYSYLSGSACICTDISV